VGGTRKKRRTRSEAEAAAVISRARTAGLAKRIWNCSIGHMRRDAGIVGPPILDEDIDLNEIEKEAEAEAEEAEAGAEAASPRGDDEMDDEDDDNGTSTLTDPGRATPLQRRWLQAMSEGKDELVARRFDQYVATLLVATYRMFFFGRINQHFDGKCTDDEILFRAEISRRQLREVLHMYGEYVGTTLRH
jgi:nitrogen permease regulator 3-like protein